MGNNNNLFTDINAITAGLNKRMTWWMGNFNVTYLRSTGALLGSLRTTSIQQRSALEFNQSGQNPNDLVNLDGRLVGDVGLQYKAQGVVRLPWGFQASASFDARKGAHKIRTRSIPASISVPSTTVLLEPRGDFGRLADVNIFDARVQKDFMLGRGARVSLFMDALNLNNEGAPQGVKSANVTNALYQFPTTFITPRKLMLSAKFHF